MFVIMWCTSDTPNSSQTSNGHVSVQTGPCSGLPLQHGDILVLKTTERTCYHRGTSLAWAKSDQVWNIWKMTHSLLMLFCSLERKIKGCHLTKKFSVKTESHLWSKPGLSNWKKLEIVFWVMNSCLKIKHVFSVSELMFDLFLVSFTLYD